MIGVIVNPRSGFVIRQGIDHTRDLLGKAVPGAEIHILEPDDDIAELCNRFRSAGFRCIAAMGGDGTVNAVAAQLVESDIALGVIPGGTLNHFARDVGVGRDVGEALKVLRHGYTMSVDVARVNDHVFLNNSSIGLYPRMVELRDRYARRVGKWRAMVRAGLLVIRDAQSMVVELDDGNDKGEYVRAYILFIGNNQYEMDLLHLGRRTSLDGGELCCFILEAHGRLWLLPLVFHFLRGSETDGAPFRSLCTSELTLIPRGSEPVEVSADGEIFTLTPPLVYRVLPRALQVIVPEPPPPESREARNAEEG
jgi:diacylglycerol kinase family enzyme